MLNPDQRYQSALKCGSRLGVMTLRGKVRSSANTSRLYIMETPSGEVRRTQGHPVPVPEEIHVGKNQQ